MQEKSGEVDEAGHPVTRMDLQIEREKIQLERERMALEREKLIAERERWKAEEGWRVGRERAGKVRGGRVCLRGARGGLLPAILGGLWMVSQQEQRDEERQQAAVQRRQELVHALAGKTNLAGRAGVLLQTMQEAGSGQGGILLILD